MKPVTIEQRFCGPPKSANGGYVGGLLAAHIDGDAEITLRAPPPLGQQLEIVTGEHGVELRQGETMLATGRKVDIALPDIPTVDFAEAEDAARRSPRDQSHHPLPMCFGCGLARIDGDGLRINPGPLLPRAGRETGTLATPWVPHVNLTAADGTVPLEFVWAALDCPAGFAGADARHLGMTGTEPMLLGRMSARIARRPRPRERCILVSWPTGRDGRKLFANSALLEADGQMLAVALTTWIVVDRQVMLGNR